VAAWEAAVIDDVNGDGIRDIVFVQGSAVTLYIGTSGWAYRSQIVNVGNNPTLPAVGDYDGDGFQDVLVSVGSDDIGGPNDPCRPRDLVLIPSDDGRYAVPAIPLGSVDGLVDITPLNLLFSALVDGLGDALLLSRCDGKVLAGLLIGTANSPLSPLIATPSLEPLGPGEILAAFGTAVGDFGPVENPGGDGIDDIAVLLLSLYDDLYRFRVQTYPNLGLGRIDLPPERANGVELDAFGTRSVDDQAELAGLIPAFTAADLDGDGTEELLVFGLALSPRNQAVLAVIQNAEVVTRHEAPVQEGNIGISRLVPTDIDLDGDLDVIGLVVTLDSGTSAYLFENDGGALLPGQNLSGGIFPPLLGDIHDLGVRFVEGRLQRSFVNAGFIGTQQCRSPFDVPIEHASPLTAADSQRRRPIISRDRLSDRPRAQE
jgi:hypothetical protein